MYSIPACKHLRTFALYLLLNFLRLTNLFFMLVDTNKNCWVKKKILSPAQVEDLSTGIRRNNRMAVDEFSGLPSDIVDSLSKMLKNMGKKLALPNRPLVDMASVCDLLDMAKERVVEEPPIVDVVEGDGAEVEQEGEEVVDDDLNDALGNEIEVDDIEPLAPFSIREARVYASRLFKFVTINID